MSSTDHLPMIDSAMVGSLSSSAHSPLPSRSSADDSTPTISTLSGGAIRLRRELGPLLGGAAYSLASSGSVLSNTAGSVAATAFSSLSLSTPASISSLSTPGPATADLENKYNLTPMHNADKTTVGVKCDANGLLVSHLQAHSTPSLIGTGTGASGWRKQLDPATSFPGCNGSFALGENQQSQKEERCSTENVYLERQIRQIIGNNNSRVQIACESTGNLQKRQ
uniref:CG32687 n=1 Tax=Globodera pallida TaxID=36090 RepID=A0A183CAW2_GLOPA